MRHNRTPILYEIFAAYGNATQTAKALGVSKQCVAAWVLVPLKHVNKIAEDTGIPRDRLRPDIYGKEEV